MDEHSGSSRSAEHVALFRALEARRPGGGIITDPFAVRLLPPRYRALLAVARLAPAHRSLVRYIDRRWSGGPRASAVARTRLLDDWLDAALAAGAVQLVLLGAGFDSRAHRVAARAFEVDHPATQATKRQRLGRRSRPDVRFVPVDLSADDLGAALLGAGFDPTLRTAVVWEGVTNYLTASAVSATLGSLVALCPAGSRILFTYVDRAVLDGTANYPGAVEWHDAVRRGGEPWTFGFVPRSLPAYLADRGLRLLDDLSTRDAAERYLTPVGRTEPTAEFYRVAVAEVC